MAEIARSESNFYTEAVSSTGCKGIWQICPPPADAGDPKANARYAVGKWRGNKDLSDWTKYNPTAARLVAEHKANPRKAKFRSAGLLPNIPGTPGYDPTKPFDLTPDLGDDDGGGPLPGLGDLGEIKRAIEDVAVAIGAIAKFFSEFARKIAEPDTWLDAAKVAIGAWLLLMGLRRMFELSTG